MLNQMSDINRYMVEASTDSQSVELLKIRIQILQARVSSDNLEIERLKNQIIAEQINKGNG